MIRPRSALRALVALVALVLMPAPASADYAATVLADNPVGYWQLYESSGTTAEDATTNNRDGTYDLAGSEGTLGAAGLLAGQSGDLSFQMNGGNGKMTVPDNAAFNFGTSAFSVEFWIRHNSTAESWQTFVSKFTSYQTNGWLVVRNSSNNRLCVWMGNANRACAPSDYNTSTDYHIVVTRSGSNTILYQNGVAGTTDTSLSASYDANSVGAVQVFAEHNNSFTSSAQRANISDVALYNVALTGTQVTTHYNCGSAGTDCASSTPRRIRFQVIGPE